MVSLSFHSSLAPLYMASFSFNSNADFLKLFFWNQFPPSKLSLRGGNESVCLLPYNFFFNSLNTGFIHYKSRWVNHIRSSSILDTAVFVMLQCGDLFIPC